MKKFVLSVATHDASNKYNRRELRAVDCGFDDRVVLLQAIRTPHEK
jgi:hypothetical protein